MNIFLNVLISFIQKLLRHLEIHKTVVELILVKCLIRLLSLIYKPQTVFSSILSITSLIGVVIINQTLMCI